MIRRRSAELWHLVTDRTPDALSDAGWRAVAFEFLRLWRDPVSGRDYPIGEAAAIHMGRVQRARRPELAIDGFLRSLAR